MKIALLSRNRKLYSSRRLIEAAANRLRDEGHPDAAFARRQAARWHSKYARRLLKRNRPDEARQAFERAAELHPLGRLDALRARFLGARRRR